MKRTGRVLCLLAILLSCMAGMWMFQAWRESRETTEHREIHNAYITAVSAAAVTIVTEEGNETIKLASAISEQNLNGIADLYVENEQVVRIRKKPEDVRGKVLKIRNHAVVIKEYGEIALDPHFCVYHLAKDGQISCGSLQDMIVGRTDIRFAAAGGKICAVVIPDTEMKEIRVLLTDDATYDMSQVVLTATTDYTVCFDGGQKEVSNVYSFKKGEKITFKPKQITGHTVVTPEKGGKIRVESLKRQYGAPEYRGTIEIEKEGDMLHLINEVSLEEYLYSVVPSEMPTEYEKEALKAQAVCARSYAAEHRRQNELAEYGAHIDDTVSYQVYNNMKEEERAVEAVEATKGQVVAYKGKTAATYFFSATCGSTAGTKDVWFTEKDTAYLQSVMQNETRKKSRLSDEKAFVTFIKEAEETYDSNSPWYRWQAVITKKSMQKSLEAGIKKRWSVNPTQIRTKQKDGTYRSQEIDSVGAIQKVSIEKRGSGGVAVMAEVTGEKAVVRIYTEYNIRCLLAGEKTGFQRNDGSEVTGLGILPSGFFYMEEQGDSYRLYGGGYGHGVGMSQNGANTLAGKGKQWQDILKFYFPHTTLQSL